METAERIFISCIILGLMIMFTVAVEKFTLHLLPKRLRMGDRTVLLLALLAGGLLIFGLARGGDVSNPQSLNFQQAGNAVGLVAAAGLGGGFILVQVMAFVSKKIEPVNLALLIGGFFAVSILAYLTLRPLFPSEVLHDNDIVFLCAAIAVTIVGMASLLMRGMLRQAPAPEQMKINPRVDSLSFGEKRRQRLNKKRERR
jgi:drug/metabolite transporter (DMT)-like permease